MIGKGLLRSFRKADGVSLFLVICEVGFLDKLNNFYMSFILTKIVLFPYNFLKLKVIVCNPLVNMGKCYCSP